jgi:hypothetical protein
LEEEISNVIGPEEVCGRVVEGGRIPLAKGDSFEEVEYGGTYKYLGMDKLFAVNPRTQ